MNKLRYLGGFAVTLLLAASPQTAQAQGELSSNPEDLARRSHDLSMSDVMYQQEDFRALYYQNLEIIQVLKEIREELHTFNVRDAKDSGK